MTEAKSAMPFYQALTETVFFAAAEIFPDKGTIRLHHAQGAEDALSKGGVFPLSALIADLNARVVTDSGHLLDMTEADFAAVMRAGDKKDFFLTLEERQNIINRYVLTLFPTHDHMRLYVTVIRLDDVDEAITIIIKKTPVTFRISDITYVDYGNHCAEFHGNGRISRFFSVSFGDVAETLLRHDNFIRSYKNCIVNMDAVKGIENDAFVLKTGEIIAIPKRRLKEIIGLYEEYLALSQLRHKVRMRDE